MQEILPTLIDLVNVPSGHCCPWDRRQVPVTLLAGRALTRSSSAKALLLEIVLAKCSRYNIQLESFLGDEGMSS